MSARFVLLELARIFNDSANGLGIKIKVQFGYGSGTRFRNEVLEVFFECEEDLNLFKLSTPLRTLEDDEVIRLRVDDGIQNNS